MVYKLGKNVNSSVIFTIYEITTISFEVVSSKMTMIVNTSSANRVLIPLAAILSIEYIWLLSASLWKINQNGIDIMFKNIFTINDVIFSLIQGLFISIFQPSYDRWYVFGYYSHTTMMFTVICVRHKFKGYSLKTL